ncbi:response regulator [Rhodoferax fermentans]|nr:response regulator [Rhodoferax fermentans]
MGRKIEQLAMLHPADSPLATGPDGPSVASVPTILMVDDHPAIRRLLRVALGNTFRIIEAESGVDALAAIQREHPRLVLLDVMMPGELDGLQVLDAIRADPSHRDTVVAMLSARGQAQDNDSARCRGADAYFVKPFSPLQVVCWVKDKLKQSETRLGLKETP